jgi:hypothetical protein
VFVIVNGRSVIASLASLHAVVCDPDRIRSIAAP